MSKLVSTNKYLDDIIYKVKKVNKNKVDTIYVFYGNDNIIDEKKITKQIFTDKEYDDIQKNKTKIVFTKQKIYLDDTITTIKIKILNELDKKLSFEELYLFCKKYEKLNSISVYQTLTQNKKINLTKLRLNQFIENLDNSVVDNDIKNIEDKEIYTYEDIFQMNIDDKNIIVNKVLGQKFFIVENEYPFICNPFKVTEYDKFLEKNSRKSLSTLNNNLLLNSGKILDDSIYLCLAEDVLNYAENNDIDEEITMKIYFPFLYNKNIYSLNDLEGNRQKLITDNKVFNNEKTINLFNTINMFYGVYHQRKNELKYLKKGIKYLKAIMKPEFNIKIPLEVIFKVIHANELKPLIKYNPSSRQENTYRLYTDKISIDGRKIPYLKKANIFKLIKTIGRTKSVAIYIERNNEQMLICEFDEYGFITIIAEFNTLVDVEEIDETFGKLINPIIQEIKNVIEQSGYTLKLFNSLNDNNIEITQMTYETQINIKKIFDIDKYKNCINSVFINESNKLKKNQFNLRFKRVSNFSKFTSQEAFILEKAEQGLKANEIIQELVDNYHDLTLEEARELVRKIANELEVERGVRKSDIKIKENPGFKTYINVDIETALLKIVVENINNLNYLYTLPIYLDTIIRLTQNDKSSNYPLKEINKICQTSEIVDVKFPDIISSTESSINEIEYVEKKNPKGAFSIFFDDDDDEYEYERVNEYEDENNSTKLKGGLSSSEYSITSESDTPLVINASVIKSKSNSSVKSLKSLDSISSENEDNKSLINPIVKSKLKKKETDEDEIESNLDGDETYSESSTDETEIKNIDGMKLNKPYYFQTMIEKKDPILILKEDTKEYNSYSRTCLSDKRRQPVILTDAQLEKINKEHPGFLREQDVLKYGSDEKHKFNYICPRYWCLKSNSFIDPNDIKEIMGKDGKKEYVHKPNKGPSCGKVLPKKEKKVKPGYYIYEFNEKSYPGMITGKHPKGLCLPCCFTNYNTEGRIKAKNACLKNNVSVNKELNENYKNKKIEKDVEYILGPEKFPLDAGRWGYLPPEIQTLLYETNADCKINTDVKNVKPCLLRHGVEINKKQSFISAISDELFFAKKVIDEITGSSIITNVLSIKEMKEKIIKAINIDTFIKYQNGNLVNDFNDLNKDVSFDNYKKTKLYSKINFNNKEETIYFKKIVTAFENFKSYLRDDDTIIDHTYLWDIICIPNKLLFPNGVNLVIFNLPNDDITNNVQLICPSNHYSSEFFQSVKSTIFLLKQDEYYEPIYLYLNTKNKLIVTKEFDERKAPSNIKELFKNLIKPFYELICRPMESMPNVYKAQKPLLLTNLIKILNQYDYDVTKMVMNFNNKIIGVIAKDPNMQDSCFVPCYPCAFNEDINLDYVFMNDLSIWTTYEKTVHFLNKLVKTSKKRKNELQIPCAPAFKIIEDELVVGILTNTNQFIQISQPIHEDEIKSEYDLPSIKDTDYIVNSSTISKSNNLLQSDVIIQTETGVDKEREDYIKKIKLETNFYNVFRNTIRILLNNYENIKIREKIEIELSKEYIIYSEKLNRINELLIELVGTKIQFIGDKNYYKLINEVSTCIVKDKDKCVDTPNLCFVTQEDKCNLILPEKNLITEKNNEPIYFGKMSDELIRYNRIKSFMFQPHFYLSFGNIGYNLKENEIILMQSSLTQEYFENLIPANINTYVKKNSYDEVQPIITQIYENKIKLTDKANVINENIKCDKIEKSYITSGMWKKCFPLNYKEIEYSKQKQCTFHVIIDLIYNLTGVKYDINNIRNELYDEYKKYLEKYKNKIINILILEGKKTLCGKVLDDKMTFINLIYSEDYFLTTLDLWLLVNKFKIPSIFISQKTILQTRYDKNNNTYYKNIFVGYGDKNDDFVFIVIPGLRNDNIPNFKFIKDDNNKLFISLNKLTDECRENIKHAIIDKISIDTYFENYKILLKTTYIKKIVVESESDNDEKT